MSLKKLKLPIRKRSYLLLEVIVSISLVLLVLTPLLKPLLGIKKESLARCERFEMDRLSRSLFSEIKTRLHSHTHAWSQVEEKIEGIDLGPQKIGNKIYQASYNIVRVSSHQKLCGDKFLLAECTLFLKSKNGKTTSFTKPLILERRHA